ncbi:MAG: hypothetical protein LC624_02280 [Halobacteriales archaeon]|nr:hypothetical protein [Halobacteriales archaeon]
MPPVHARPPRLAALALALLLAAPALALPASPEQQLVARARAALADAALPLPAAADAYADAAQALVAVLRAAGLPIPVAGPASPTLDGALAETTAALLAARATLRPADGALPGQPGDVAGALALTHAPLPGGSDVRATAPAALRVARAVQALEAALLGLRVAPGCGPLGIGSFARDLDGDGQADFVVDDAGTDAVHRESAMVLVDTSGNDRYDGAGSAGPQQVRVVLDLCGDDTYGQGAGGALSGLALLVDGGGNDTYTSGTLAQGAGALGGIGLLWDQGGNDRYAVATFGQGVGFGGIGVLLDTGGDDRYIAGALAQGAGVARVLYDQGEGIVAPGYGLLVDNAGRNVWAAETVAQGAGYGGFGQEGASLSLGALVHGDGGDAFVLGSTGGAVPIIQGQAAADRVSRAFLLGGGGDDAYLVAALQLADGADVNLTARGQAWSDSGYAVLLDTGGNDAYAVAAVAMAVADAGARPGAVVHASGQAMTEGGTAQLVERDGNDRYVLHGAALAVAPAGPGQSIEAGPTRAEAQGQGWATIGGVGSLHDLSGSDARDLTGLAAPVAAAVAGSFAASLAIALPLDCAALDLSPALGAGARFDACPGVAVSRALPSGTLDAQAAVGDADVVAHGQGYAERASTAALGDAQGDDANTVLGVAEPVGLAQGASLSLDVRDDLGSVPSVQLTLGLGAASLGATSARLGDVRGDAAGQGTGFQEGQGALLDDGGSDVDRVLGEARTLLFGQALGLPGAGSIAETVRLRARLGDEAPTTHAVLAGSVAHALGLALQAAFRGEDASGLAGVVAPDTAPSSVAMVAGSTTAAAAGQGSATDVLAGGVLQDAGDGRDAWELTSAASPAVAALAGSLGPSQADALDVAASTAPDDAAFQRGTALGAPDVSAAFDGAFADALARGTACPGPSGLAACVARTVPDGFAALDAAALAEASSAAAGFASVALGMDPGLAAQTASSALHAFAAAFRAAAPGSAGSASAIVVLGPSEASVLGQGAATDQAAGAALLGTEAQSLDARASASLRAAVVADADRGTAALVNGALRSSTLAKGWASTLARGALLDAGGDDAYAMGADAFRDVAVRGGSALDVGGRMDAAFDGRAAGLDRSTALFVDLGGADAYSAPRGADGTQWSAPDHTSVALGLDEG